VARSYRIACRRPPCGRFLFAGMARSYMGASARDWRPGVNGVAEIDA
jgi:hypothetical protein